MATAIIALPLGFSCVFAVPVSTFILISLSFSVYLYYFNITTNVYSEAENADNVQTMKIDLIYRSEQSPNWLLLFNEA